MAGDAGSILVVEDDAVNREFLGRFLSDHGFEVTVVETGEEALAHLQTHRYDLILLDLMLPGKNGGEVAWAARERGVDAPILAISGAMDVWDPSDLADLGVSRSISKPYENQDLLACVRELVASARAAD